MKEIRVYNFYNNGSNSKVHVYFKDGTQWHRTVEAYEVQQLAKIGETYLETLMQKYKDPQPKPEYQKIFVNKKFETL